MPDRKPFHCDRIGACDSCGNIGAIEIHHRRPLAIGGTNDPDNLMCLCEACHNQAHKSNRGELIRAGMQNALNQDREPLVSKLDLEIAFLRLLRDADGQRISGSEILDVMYSLPVVKHRKPTTDFYSRMTEYHSLIDDIVNICS